MVDGKYCLGIIGFGGMANWHNELISGVEKTEWNAKKVSGGFENLLVKGVFDIDPARMEYAKTLGLHQYASREELLLDPEIDIVLCATPNDVHKDVVISALRAGKNVVCEKPVAMNSMELSEMIAVANECKKMFTVHQNRRWDEDFITIKKIYNEQLLGEIFHIESRVHGSRGIPGDWRGEVCHGGGMMLDWGVHIIDQMLQLVDEKITSLYCTVDHITNETVDDGFKLTLNFESGKTALLEVGTSNFIELPRWYLLGRDGTAVIEDWALKGKMVRITDWDKNDAVPIKTAAGLTKTMAPRTEETIKTEDLPKVEADIKDFYRNVIKTVGGSEEQIIKHNELQNVMKIMELALESARINRVIEL